MFKPRQHFRLDGTPKRPRTLADAQRFCQQNPQARWYRCSLCNEIHVGHKPTAVAA